MTTAAETAKAIRKELKEKFPNTKFRVTSKNFSGGNSVDIFWTDGVMTDDVNAVVKKYEYGSFDGMTDCYNMDNCRDDIPQAKYVMTNRSMSAEVKAAIKSEIANEYGLNMDNESEVMGKLCMWPDVAIYRTFAERNY